MMKADKSLLHMLFLMLFLYPLFAATTYGCVHAQETTADKAFAKIKVSNSPSRSQVISASRAFDASTWLMYLPPGTSAWVPLYKIEWGFSGTASGPVPSANGQLFSGWSISDPYRYYSAKMWLPEFPSWTDVLSQIRGYTPQ